MRLSDQLDKWLTAEGEHTLGGLIETFGEKSFALLFVLLLGVPALPIPTAGVTHVFEVIAVIVAAQLIIGRHELWLPQRWRHLELAGARQQRFLTGLMKLIRRLERVSRPRLTFLFHHRVTDVVSGLLILVGTAGAFLAPPFSGLDTLPALGVVLVSLAILLEDVLVALAGIVMMAVGITLEIVLGEAAIRGISSVL